MSSDKSVTKVTERLYSLLVFEVDKNIMCRGYFYVVGMRTRIGLNCHFCH